MIHVKYIDRTVLEYSVQYTSATSSEQMKVLNPYKNLLHIDTLFAPPDFLNFSYYAFMVIQYLSRMILITLCSQVLGECYIS